MSDIYHSPEKFGLKIVAEDNAGETYEFDMLVLFERVSDGALFLGEDSGCSCPSPFEDVGIGDLVPATLEAVKKWESEGFRGRSAASVRDALRAKGVPS